MRKLKLLLLSVLASVMIATPVYAEEFTQPILGEPVAMEDYCDETDGSCDAKENCDYENGCNVEEIYEDGAAAIVNVQKRSEADIKAFVSSHPASLTQSVSFQTNPNVTTAPYSAGKLSQATLNSALNMLNQIRYIAGLDANVTLNSNYSDLCQAASVVNYVNRQLSHYPGKPVGMSDSLYNAGYEGASSSNIAWASWSGRSINETLITGWLGDSDSTNIDRLGHRRWIINPSMGKTGFGATSGTNGTYSAMYSFDSSNWDASQSGVVWPAQVTPIEYFNNQDAWSISTGRSESISSVKVTIRNVNTGKTWNFSQSSSDGYFNVNNDGYGQSGCVIFRPNSISISSGDTYQVNISGLSQGNAQYNVKFFSLNGSTSGGNNGGNNGGNDNGNNNASGDNPIASTYTCIDGSSLSTTANGRPKLLIYYGYTCGNCKSTIKSIVSSNWINNNDIDIYALETAGDNFTAQEELDLVKNYKDTYAPNSEIKFSYKSVREANSDMFSYAKKYKAGYQDGYSYTISWPVIVLIDANNNVKYVNSGYKLASELESEALSKYIAGWKSGGSTPTPTPAKPTPTPAKPTPTPAKPTPTPGINPQNPGSNGDNLVDIALFVARLYIVALERDYDDDGLVDWTYKLYYGEQTGAEVAQGFIFSEEFKNRNLSDSDFVDTLYFTMFGREADADGKATWMKALSNGMSREYVYHGFAEGTEFKNLCNEYGIKQGTVTLAQNRDKNEQLTAFVARNYTKALGRAAEEAGINDWTGRILEGRATPADVTAGFIFSPEFTNKNLSNEEFLKVLYQTYFDRDPDANGFNGWMEQLNNGVSREYVVNTGFSCSQEFANLVASFGL